MSSARAKDDSPPKYPNALEEWINLRGYKKKYVADKTNIPYRSLWEYIAERTPIPEDRLEALAAYLQCTPEQLVPKSTPIYWNVPHQHNPFFTGRDAILQSLHDTLTEGRTAALVQAISGLGGIGKTQTAVEYAHRHQDDYEAILWVKADSPEILVSDFVNIAHLLRLPEKDEQDQSHIVNAVKRWLRVHANWLLTFDNVEDLAVVQDFIPTTGKGHILLTTRSQSLEGIAHPIRIKTMNPDEGTLLLLRRAYSIGTEASLEDASEADLISARDIVSEMDGLPLALDQAGAYIENTGCSILDYLNSYRAHRAVLLQKRGSTTSDHKDSVATTFSVTFQKIRQSYPAAAELLHLCAFLDPDEIPEEIFVLGAADLNPVLVAIVENPVQLDETIGALLKYSLVNRNARKLRIHRLVQAVLQDEMDQDTRRSWAERTVRIVNRAFPDAQFATWSRCQQYLSHAGVCATLIEQEKMVFPEAARLLHQAGTYLYERGSYTESESHLRRALAIREQQLGLEDLGTTATFNMLAKLYYVQGRYAEAEPLFLQALKTRRQTLRSGHPEVAMSLNDLAVLYREMGRYEEAEQLFLEALEVRKQIFGAVHPDLATSLNDLAMLYFWQRRYAEAEPLVLQALEVRKQMFGAVHPDLATSLHFVAVFYGEQGKDAEAKSLSLQALEIRKQVLEPSHPDVADSLNYVARLYRKQGNYAEAELLFRNALTIREQVLGLKHPDVANSLNFLALLYQDQGKYTEAETLFLRALEIKRQALEPGHLETLQSLNVLAIFYHEQGRYNEAEPFYSIVLEFVKKMLEPKYPDVIEGLYDIERLYRRANDKYEAVESLVTRALQVFEKVLGPEHISVATCSYYLAELYYAQSKYVEAEYFYQRALWIHEQRLEAQQPQTLVILERFARLLRNLERTDEATALEARIEAARNVSL